MSFSTSDNLFMMIPKKDLDRLYAERDYLKEKLAESENSNELLKNDIVALNMRINALENENKELKWENVDLKNENRVQGQRITVLETKINQLESENGELKTQIIQLRGDMKHQEMELMAEKLYNKLLYAIQDLNETFELERSGHSYLASVREDRVGNAHYLKRGDPDHLKQFKIRLIHNQLSAADDNVRSKFDDNYDGNVLDNMLKFTASRVNKVELNVSEREKRKAESWWK
jgi:DNA repair exonuclease SbcCD ATPase subunit